MICMVNSLKWQVQGFLLLVAGYIIKGAGERRRITPEFFVSVQGGPACRRKRGFTPGKRGQEARICACFGLFGGCH